MLDQTYWTSLANDYVTAYGQAFGRVGSRNAILLAMSVAEHETNNGRAWPGTNNFGACQLRPLTVQEYASWTSGQLKAGDYNMQHDGVLHVDTHPTPSGPAPYPVWFAAFPDRVAGIVFFLKTLWRLSTAMADVYSATCDDLARAMYLHGYYEGAHAGGRPISQRSVPLTPPEQANVNDYSGAMQKCMDVISAAIPDFLQETPPPAPGQEAGEAGADEGLPHYNPSDTKDV